MAATSYEWQRIKRLLWPSRYDRAAWLLLNAVGPSWLLLHGWRREYRVPGKQLVIDLAHPRLKLALEADGERYHMDIVHEAERDAVLETRGWSVKHYRYPILKNQPRRVKREVRKWYWNRLLFHLRPK